ncbi:MAG: peptidoglycan DD-metalloendopeptidase family protein [Oscillospiraceae bacterium]
MEITDPKLQKTEYTDGLDGLSPEEGPPAEEESPRRRGRKAPSRLRRDTEASPGERQDAPARSRRRRAEDEPAAGADGEGPEAAGEEGSQTEAPPRRQRPALTPAALWQRFWAELKKECVELRRAVAAFFLGWGEKLHRGNVVLREVVRSKREKEFPESSHFLLQLLLFLWGMLPYLLARMKEAVLHRRRRSIGRSNRFQHMKERFHMRPAWFLCLAGTVACVVIFFSLYTFASSVLYNGEELGVVRSTDDAAAAVEHIEAATKDAVDSRYTLDEGAVTTTTTLASRSELLSEEELEDILSEKIGLVVHGYGLYINDELICATQYEYVLEDLLHQLQYAYTTENTVSCDFEEKVEVRQGYVPTEYLMSIGRIAEVLNSTHEEEVTYTVKSGDVWSRIANDNGMTSAELLKLNPGYNISRLHVGDTLVLSAAVPYLTITFTEQQHYVSNIPYEVEYQEDPTMYKGDYKVLSAGVYGKADVVADVTYKNGEEVGRTVRAYTELTAPVTELQAVGTKARPTWLPTGSFRWPCSGSITSYFGYRTLWGRSNYHGGIDIANSRGTPIYAADGGTVTYAGWYSTYGYLVIIDHGNGFETYYGHNSALLVSKGDHVYKGQQIARMGMTGNASGNHCHFEVRYHGVRKNPLNYL